MITGFGKVWRSAADAFNHVLDELKRAVRVIWEPEQYGELIEKFDDLNVNIDGGEITSSVDLGADSLRKIYSHNPDPIFHYGFQKDGQFNNSELNYFFEGGATRAQEDGALCLLTYSEDDKSTVKNLSPPTSLVTSHDLEFTAVVAPGVYTTGNIKTWGIYDDYQGFFIRQNGSSTKFVTRFKGVDKVHDLNITPDDSFHKWSINFHIYGSDDIQIWYDNSRISVLDFCANNNTPLFDLSNFIFTAENWNVTNNSESCLRIAEVYLTNWGAKTLKGETLNCGTAIALNRKSGEIDFSLSGVAENQLYDKDQLLTVEQGETVAQMVRLSNGCLCGVQFRIDGESPASDVLDNFETYADNAALQSVWLSTNATRLIRTLETTIFYSGTKSMKIEAQRPQAQGHYVYKTWAAQDWSTHTFVQFGFRSETDSSNLNASVVIVDDLGQRTSVIIPFTATNNWELINIEFDQFSMLDGTFDWQNITGIRILINNLATSNAIFYIDDISLGSTANGTLVKLEVYNFGSLKTPTNLSQGTKLLISGDQDNIIFGIPTDGGWSNIIMNFNDESTRPDSGDYCAFVLTNIGFLKKYIKGSTDNRFNSGQLGTINTLGDLSWTTSNSAFIVGARASGTIAQIDMLSDVNLTGAMVSLYNVYNHKVKNALVLNHRWGRSEMYSFIFENGRIHVDLLGKLKLTFMNIPDGAVGTSLGIKTKILIKKSEAFD